MIGPLAVDGRPSIVPETLYPPARMSLLDLRAWWYTPSLEKPLALE